MKRQQIFHNLNKVTECFLQDKHRRCCQCMLTLALTVGHWLNATFRLGAGFWGPLCRRLLNICKVIFIPVFMSQVLLHISYVSNIQSLFSCKQKHFFFILNNHTSVTNQSTTLTFLQWHLNTSTHPLSIPLFLMRVTGGLEPNPAAIGQEVGSTLDRSI